MGQSTDGILVFGIDLGESAYFLDEFDGDWEEFLDSLGNYPKHGEPGYDYKNREKFEKELGVSLTRYCSHDYPMYILAVRGTETVVSRGYVEIISPPEMNIWPEQIQKLKDFWDTYVAPEKPDDDEDEYKEQPEWTEPQWLLASMWG